MFSEIEEYLYEKIPLTRAMGVRVVEHNSERLVLEAPLELNYNHLGTAFGGSLSALAILAGYGALWLQLREAMAHVVIQESWSRFRRPVKQTLRAVCALPSEQTLARFRRDFSRKGKARLPLMVVIEENGLVAVEFEGTYVAVAAKHAVG